MEKGWCRHVPVEPNAESKEAVRVTSNLQSGRYGLSAMFGVSLPSRHV